ncbi:hypothetical protein GCM10023317_11470 [Actinopolymorpha pittospori]
MTEGGVAVAVVVPTVPSATPSAVPSVDGVGERGERVISSHVANRVCADPVTNLRGD